MWVLTVWLLLLARAGCGETGVCGGRARTRPGPGPLAPSAIAVSQRLRTARRLDWGGLVPPPHCYSGPAALLQAAFHAELVALRIGQGYPAGAVRLAVVLD